MPSMLTKIRLFNFRNFTDSVFNFSSQISAIVGKNGTGKTNILEAVNLLSTGKSFKANRTEEMIKYDTEVARVKGKINGEVLEVVLTHGSITMGSVIEKTPKKRLLVNDTPKRMMDFSTFFTTVVFRPQDIEIITSSPSLRRNFLDELLSQTDLEYRRSLLNYEKGLRRRNKVLLQIRDENVPRNSLFFWDNLLIKNGDYISAKREEFLEFLNLRESPNGNKFSVEYDKSAISETRLAQYANAEVASGTTLVGPHRDDLIFKVKDRSLSIYGSRGEQRMAVLWAKMAELEFIKEKANPAAGGPILLLDDIFSELDHEHREVINEIVRDCQTLITSPDPHYVEDLKAQEVISL